MNAPIQLSREQAAKNPSVCWDRVNAFLAFADLAKLSPVQRVAWLAYWYMAQVEGGGHREYFLSPRRADSDEVRSALRATGATEQAAILAAALDAVRDAAGRAPGEYADRFVAGVERADLAKFDEAFERCTRSVHECLMDYVRGHESEFVEWRP